LTNPNLNHITHPLYKNCQIRIQTMLHVHYSNILLLCQFCEKIKLSGQKDRLTERGKASIIRACSAVILLPMEIKVHIFTFESSNAFVLEHNGIFALSLKVTYGKEETLFLR
jgi:hypothetical protein